MTNSPIIGILTVGLTYQLEKAYGNTHKTYIAASYVKYLESAGARVVPIWVGKDYVYYRNILKRVNGVLLPNGADFLTEINGYTDAARIILKLAISMNLKRDYFPIWGTCLGLDLLLFLTTRQTIDPRQECDRLNESFPLTFKPQFRESRLFKDIPEDIVNIFSKEDVTYHNHCYCIPEFDFYCFNLDKDWRILSVNCDPHCREFISTVEHKVHPFYGVIFHPEKNAFEFSYPNVSHTSNAIKASHYFAEFFVNECRKNEHLFDNRKDEIRHLIYNFPVVFTRERGAKFFQSYMFSEDADYPSLFSYRRNCNSKKKK